ncbi:hypothetical protein GCM10011519_15620 [Marmoricola endophyticus]|uniref:Methyltransferase domain-containing protein n=1 Tax=Marmoricola endophyticus TaxID=2040280 RepID=A0A917BIC5_9ACTN|nr:class I SAM-dependent methyltransferase [Marmoricola endophyticus]GGF42621.1 hypothetical protein GCM10011519_15620 [Marmoricola endophyticus]
MPDSAPGPAAAPRTRIKNAVADRLPADTRRRLGRIKRAVLDQPEPAPSVPAPRRTKAGRPIATAPKPDGKTRKEYRQDHVFGESSRSGRFLEIGPAHNGTLPRRDGFDTRNVDYLDRAGLVAKYAEFAQYDPDDIEEVDYVLEAGAALAERIPERFDLVLASHVLEHTTSLVDFLNECSALLEPTGHVALVVPDHRFCFDRFRERSAISRVIDAHLQPPSVHTPGTLAEFTLNAVAHGDARSWAAGHRGRYRFLNDAPAAVSTMEKAKGPDYIDVHNWIFSPNHLRLLLHDLAELGLIDLRERYFHPTIGHEFFLNLSRDGAGPGISREELARRADAEKRGLDPLRFQQPPG